MKAPMPEPRRDQALFDWKRAGPNRKWNVFKTSKHFYTVRIRGQLPDGSTVKVMAVAATIQKAGSLAIAKYDRSVHANSQSSSERPTEEP